MGTTPEIGLLTTFLSDLQSSESKEQSSCMYEFPSLVVPVAASSDDGAVVVADAATVAAVA